MNVNRVVDPGASEFVVKKGETVEFRGLSLELVDTEFHPLFLRINDQQVYWPLVQHPAVEDRKNGAQPNAATKVAQYTIRGFGQFLLTRRNGGMVFKVMRLATPAKAGAVLLVA